MMPVLFAVIATAAVVLAFIGYRAFATDPLDSLSPEDQLLIKETSDLRKAKRMGIFQKLGLRLGPQLGDLFGGQYREWVDKRIVLAGRKDFANYQQFMAFKGSVLILCGIGGLGALLLLKMPFILALVLLIGLFSPDLILVQQGKKRQERIDDDLPDFLDILAVTVTAGLSFRSALAKVTDRTEGPLQEEMQTVLRQIELGEPVYEAFDALRKRTSSDSLDSFVTSLLQAEELGAPLAETLETISLDMRQTTAQKARQSAAKASPKIAGVVTTIMIPGTMVLILASMYFAGGLDEMDFGLGD